jgi:hypothetical protein
MASCMLHAKELLPKIWGEELNCANYIQKINPHGSAMYNTPFEDWSDNKSEVTHFHIFGSRAWARVPSKKRKALDPQSHPCIFFGYPDGVKGYILRDPSMDQIIIERNVQFKEIPSHAPHEPHVEAFVLPPVVDDESTHLDHTIDLISNIESKDSEDTNAHSEHSDVESVHAYAQVDTFQTLGYRRPCWGSNGSKEEHILF